MARRAVLHARDEPGDGDDLAVLHVLRREQLPDAHARMLGEQGLEPVERVLLDVEAEHLAL